MPLSRHALFADPQAIDLTVDPRWTMAFAAGIPDDSPTLFDTAGTQAVHPLFPVAAEWQLITAMKASGTGLSADEARRGIHVGHDLVLHRTLPPSAEVHLEVRTVALGRRRAGATQTIEFTATSADGPLWSTRMTSLYLGVELDGEPSEVESPWPASPSVAAPGGEAVASTTTHVRPVDAHVYSECARIWNPIHTDIVAARRAGLDNPILHGTAILARAVSLVARMEAVDLAAIRRVGAQFSAQVALDTTIEARLLSRTSDTLTFDMLLADGRAALREAWLSTATVTPW